MFIDGKCGRGLHWNSVHLAFIASDRELKRLAASLYTLPI